MRPPQRELPGIVIDTPFAAPGQRIGLMGGSFNPPHEGHLTVSRTAARRLRLDRIWWLVSPGNPLKANDALPPLTDRIAACRRVTHKDHRIVVTGFEAELATPYTASTLAFLTRRFPMTRFVWVMGADNLASFHRWRRWQTIAATVPIAVVDRPGWHLKAIASPAARALARHRVSQSLSAQLPARRPPAWVFLSTRLSTLSSTDLRQRGGREPGL